MKRVRDHSVVVLVSAVALVLAGCAGEPETESSNWARFRGPGGSGVSGEEGLPVQWGEDGSGVRWATEISGPAISSPIAIRGQVFLTAETESEEGTTLKVVSLDLATGEQLWETVVVSRGREDFPPRAVDNSSAGPSPATDGELVFAYFGTHLAALDFDGEVVWLKEVDPRYLDEVYYGAGSSVVLTDEHVILFRDREKVEPEVFGWLAAFDKRTGARQWRKKWTDTCCSYTTPLLLETEFKTEILVAHAGMLASYDADSGKRLWDQEQVVNQPVASPVLVGDVVCSASGGHGVKNVTCWNLRTNKKGNTRPTPLWTSTRGVNSIASPVLYDGLLFSVSDKGVMYCFDALTGETQWVERLEAGGYSASLLAGDGKIYVFSRWGPAYVIAASREYQLLAENKLPHGDIIASPGLVDGCLLVRSENHLMCVEGSETAA